MFLTGCPCMIPKQYILYINITNNAEKYSGKTRKMTEKLASIF